MTTPTRPVGAYWCAERGCRRWLPCDRTDDGTYTCQECGETVLCDECGRPWTDDHACPAEVLT